MIRVDITDEFANWLKKLKDRRARLIINTHVDRITNGNFGKTRNVGEGIWEKKINYGKGYRLYYYQRGKVWVLLLCGGDKSTQQADIDQAKEIKKGIK